MRDIGVTEKTLYQAIGELDEEYLAESEEPFSAKGKTIRFKAGRTLLIAALIACIGAVSVYAVSSALWMKEGKLPFFQNSPQSQKFEGSAETLRGSYDVMQKDLEAFMTPVGLSSTSNGVTVTLDSLSMDAAGLDLFMTISGQEAIQQVLEQARNAQSWETFFAVSPTFHGAKVNGKPILWEDTTDWYLAEDGTLKVWRHYLLNSLPKGETLKLELFEDCVLKRDGEWQFELELDGKSVRANSKIAEPQSWQVEGLQTSPDNKAQTFHLNYLAFGPKGGVLRSGDWRNGELQADDFYIRDDTGKEIYLSTESSGAQESIWNLSAADPQAHAVILTPVKDKGNFKTYTVSTQELKQGVQLEFTSLGGYTVQNFKIEGNSISYELVPYGWNRKIGQHLMPVYPQADEALYDGIISDTVDPRTGVIQERYDFYTATEQDLQNIAEWTWSWSEAELLKDQDITAELFEGESLEGRFIG